MKDAESAKRHLLQNKRSAPRQFAFDSLIVDTAMKGTKQSDPAPADR